MNHFTDAVNMVEQWRKATPQEATNGFVAMFPMTYFCQVDNRILTIDFEGKCKETGLRYKQKATWIGYTEAMLEKRAKRGDDVPSFWKQDSSEAWLEYIETGKASKEVAEILPTLGSYAA